MLEARDTGVVPVREEVVEIAVAKRAEQEPPRGGSGLGESSESPWEPANSRRTPRPRRARRDDHDYSAAASSRSSAAKRVPSSPSISYPIISPESYPWRILPAPRLATTD